MESTKLKFVGHVAGKYVFEDQSYKKLSFSKCRKDLIEDFKLYEPDNINKWFQVKFFKTKPLSSHEIKEQEYIISDLIELQ